MAQRLIKDWRRFVRRICFRKFDLPRLLHRSSKKMSLRQQLSRISKTIALLILFSFILTNTFAAQTYLNKQVNVAKKFASEYPALAKYATDLTALARDGKILVNPNFEREADLLVKSLANRDLRQTVIL